MQTIPTDVEDRFRFIRSYAEESIRRADLKFSGIGSVKADGTVGPLASGWLFNSPSPPYFFGPFENNRDRFLCQIDNILDLICDLQYFRQDPIYAYIVHKVLRDLVAGNAELAKPSSATYIAHSDEASYQFLVDDHGTLLQVLDWEW